MRKLKLGSMFDGIGGWPLAAVKCGVEPVWSCEIEKFPIEVTKVRFPNMKHLGSVTDVHGDEIEPVDIITSGSPCQDLSVAGKRAGFNGSRSSLFYESVRIVREMRAATGGRFPSLYIWENVPGAFSSNQNRDFLAVLQELSETDLSMPPSGRWAAAGMVRGRSCDIAWRSLDAQYWGVPQRRNRIFLIADFRKKGRSEILFERESVSGNPPQGRTERKETSSDTDVCSDEAGEPHGDCLTPWDCQSKKIFSTDGKMQTLCAASGGGGARGMSIFSIAGNTIGRKPQNGGNGNGFQENISYTLTSMDRHAVCFEPGSIARNAGPAEPQEICSTLRANMGDNQPAVCLNDQGGSFMSVQVDQSGPLMAQSGSHQPLVVAMRERGGKPGGGKGPLLSDDLAMTLNTSNDQTIFCIQKSDTEDNQQTVYAMGSDQWNTPIMEDKSPCLSSSQQGVVFSDD